MKHQIRRITKQSRKIILFCVFYDIFYSFGIYFESHNKFNIYKETQSVNRKYISYGKPIDEYDETGHPKGQKMTKDKIELVHADRVNPIV